MQFLRDSTKKIRWNRNKGNEGNEKKQREDVYEFIYILEHRERVENEREKRKPQKSKRKREKGSRTVIYNEKEGEFGGEMVAYL